MDTVTQKAELLRQEAQPYALALVVRCESPTSAKPGARGVITPDGVITGWIGGGCAQPIVVQEALKAIQEGTPRLLRITPQAGAVEVNGIRSYEMACFSGGTMDIFVDPVLPPPQLVILGRSPVARTLAQLAQALHYEVHVFAAGATPGDFPGATRVAEGLEWDGIREPHAYVVVSTQGEDDEGAMEAAVRSAVEFVAFVASKKKWDAIAKSLLDKGMDAGRVARVHAPAGVEIHAEEPEEISLSVLAQVVSQRRLELAATAARQAPAEHGKGPGSAESLEGVAVDPICGMEVPVATARYRSHYQGRAYYFCCSGCKERFDQSPARYAAA
ncbi:MAG TPA: XdhC family protein [bacterium]|nr:XdhC family protein [bacterium]